MARFSCDIGIDGTYSTAALYVHIHIHIQTTFFPFFLYFFLFVFKSKQTYRGNEHAAGDEVLDNEVIERLRPFFHPFSAADIGIDIDINIDIDMDKCIQIEI